LHDDGLSRLVSWRPLNAAVLVADLVDALTAALAPIFGVVVHFLLLSFDSALRRIERNGEKD
jgi:hypothetical protein